MGDEEIKSWVSIDESSWTKIDDKVVAQLDKRIGEALKRFEQQMNDRLQAASQRATYASNNPGAIFDRRMNMMMRYEARSFLRSAASGILASVFGDELSGAQDSTLGRIAGNTVMATALSGPIGGIEALLFGVVQEAVRLQADYKREMEEQRKKAQEMIQRLEEHEKRLEEEEVLRRVRRDEEEFEALRRRRDRAEEKGYDLVVRQLNAQIGGAAE